MQFMIVCIAVVLAVVVESQPSNNSSNDVIQPFNRVLSLDGLCGPYHNWKLCPTGHCCSRLGWCGNTALHCNWCSVPEPQCPYLPPDHNYTGQPAPYPSRHRRSHHQNNTNVVHPAEISVQTSTNPPPCAPRSNTGSGSMKRSKRGKIRDEIRDSDLQIDEEDLLDTVPARKSSAATSTTAVSISIAILICILFSNM